MSTAGVTKSPTFVHKAAKSFAKWFVENNDLGEKDRAEACIAVLLNLAPLLEQLSTVSDEEIESVTHRAPLGEKYIVGEAPREMQAMFYLRHEAGVKAAFPIPTPFTVPPTVEAMDAFEKAVGSAFQQTREQFQIWNSLLYLSIANYFNVRVPEPSLHEGGIICWS